MKLRISRLILVFLVPQLLTGCSWLYGENGLVKDNEFTYVNSKLGKKLEIPEGLEAPHIVDQYPIPNIAKSAMNKPVGKQLDASAPVLILAVDVNSGVYSRSEKTDPTVWFRISESTVWKALLDYLKSNNVPVAQKDLSKGIIETDWVMNETDSWWNDIFGSDDELKAVRGKYQLKLVRSPKGKLTLLSIKPSVTEYLSYDDDHWKPLKNSRENSIQFLNGFLSTWAEERAFAAKKRILAANKGIQLSLGKDNNDRVAFIADAKYDRVWARLAYVAKKMGMVIDDKDQSQGIYYMIWKGKESGGFFDALMFWRDSGSVDLPLANGEYEFNLSALGDKTAITIAKKDGGFLNQKKMNKLFSYFADYFGKKRQRSRH